MTNTTETFWAVNGESLQTFAFNITTLGGDRQAPPPVRGRNIVVPYRPGTVWVPKVPDERTITLGMWVIGAEEDGSIPTDNSARRTYERNWNKLRKMLWNPRKQFTLTKRFWVPTADLVAGGVDVGPLETDGDYSLLTASAKASFSGGLTPTMNGVARAVFTVDLTLADPYFLSDEIEVEFSTSTSPGAPGPIQTIEVLGDDETTQIEVEFDGPLTSPRIDNNSYDTELWVRYATEIAADESATVRVHDFSATQYPVGDPFETSGSVQHDGSLFWFLLEPGETELELSAQAGTGTAVLRYQPRWF